MSVVGARPQFVKLSPIATAFNAADIEHVIVHTGQHYDALLSDSFFQELGIPRPDYQLAVGSGSHGKQTGQMLAELEEIMMQVSPDWVLVYGDTNSTLAAALAAVKLQIPVAHLEAGLRSFNRAMPEEHNRVLTDHCADLLLAPTEVGAQHLAAEGLAGRTVVVGDVMTDVLGQVKQSVEHDPLPIEAMRSGEYYVATLHRPVNTDNLDHLGPILASLQAMDAPVFLLAHPRLQDRAQKAGLWGDTGSLRWCDPLPYPQLVRAVMDARAVVTDSGGLQKEAFLLRTPCITVRTETEWVETVELGWNMLVEPGPQILQASKTLRPESTDAQPYGDGHAAERVCGALRDHLE